MFLGFSRASFLVLLGSVLLAASLHYPVKRACCELGAAVMILWRRHSLRLRLFLPLDFCCVLIPFAGRGFVAHAGVQCRPDRPRRALPSTESSPSDFCTRPVCLSEGFLWHCGFSRSHRHPAWFPVRSIGFGGRSDPWLTETQPDHGRAFRIPVPSLFARAPRGRGFALTDGGASAGVHGARDRGALGSRAARESPPEFGTAFRPGLVRLAAVLASAFFFCVVVALLSTPSCPVGCGKRAGHASSRPRARSTPDLSRSRRVA